MYVAGALNSRLKLAEPTREMYNTVLLTCVSAVKVIVKIKGNLRFVIIYLQPTSFSEHVWNLNSDSPAGGTNSDMGSKRTCQSKEFCI